MTRVYGRDGRELISTGQLALMRFAHDDDGGKKQARTWAVRHGIRPKAYRSSGGRGRPEALWDLADITEAVALERTAA